MAPLWRLGVCENKGQAGGQKPKVKGSLSAAQPAPGLAGLERTQCTVLVPPLQAWLRLYGYLPQSSRQMSTMRSAQIFSSALSEMQRFYGIPVTGILDEETKL